VCGAKNVKTYDDNKNTVGLCIYIPFMIFHVKHA
jgi:hypothetical protein